MIMFVKAESNFASRVANGATFSRRLNLKVAQKMLKLVGRLSHLLRQDRRAVVAVFTMKVMNSRDQWERKH